MIIDYNARRRILRFGEDNVLAALREAFAQRPDWRSFNANQLSKLLFLYSYLGTPPDDVDVEAAMPFALEDLDGVA